MRVQIPLSAIRRGVSARGGSAFGGQISSSASFINYDMNEKIGGQIEMAKEGKEKKWQEEALSVDKFTDKLGKPIEQGIKDVVIALRVNDFTPNQSCEGHITDKGSIAPWVEIFAPEIEDWREDSEKIKQWTKANLKLKQQMVALLKDFYQERVLPMEVKLHLERIGIYGAFRLKSIGAENLYLLAYEEQKEKVKIYQKEMRDFAGFLKDKFFKE
jgi:hypothetical protein